MSKLSLVKAVFNYFLTYTEFYFTFKNHAAESLTQRI